MKLFLSSLFFASTLANAAPVTYDFTVIGSTRIAGTNTYLSESEKISGYFTIDTALAESSRVTSYGDTIFFTQSGCAWKNADGSCHMTDMGTGTPFITNFSFSTQAFTYVAPIDPDFYLLQRSDIGRSGISAFSESAQRVGDTSKYAIAGFDLMDDSRRNTMDDWSKLGNVDLSTFELVSFYFQDYTRIENSSGASSFSGNHYEQPLVINGTVTALTQRGTVSSTPIPEPSNIVLFAIGLFGLVGLRMRSR